MRISVNCGSSCASDSPNKKATQKTLVTLHLIMPRLPPQDREHAAGRLAAGQLPREVAWAFDVHISTIYRLQSRLQTIGSNVDRPRAGRTRVTTAGQDRLIMRHHRRFPFNTDEETCRVTVGTHGRQLTGHTVRRRLAERNLQCRRPARGLVLLGLHHQQRLQWGQHHIHWRHREWRRVLFNDESRFCLGPPNGRIRIWRASGQRFAGANILERDRWGGESVMVWSAVGIIQRLGPVFFQNLGRGCGNGVNAKRYINEILRPHVVPFFQRHPNHLFQQDNAARTQHESLRTS